MAADDIARAVAILRAGGVVAIPTETVYGLAGAVASPQAIARIYAIKGRPQDHPLIVHLSDSAALAEYVAEVPPSLATLAARFWPGPLTVILKRGRATPLSVTGGQETVAMRVPAHPVARAILTQFGGALAAPSANRFGRISPTTAQHVRDSLGDLVDLIVDGGPAEVGIESTIVDLTSAVPAVLRAGIITPSQLQDALGIEVVSRDGGDVRAPGTLAAHYAPHARLVLVHERERTHEFARRSAAGERVVTLELAADPISASRDLYAALRALDTAGCDVIIATFPPDGEVWNGVRDRLVRAAASATAP